MSLGHIYDRAGRPVTLERWAELHEDLEYMQVAYDEVGLYRVSTVWLGLDHGFGWGGPRPVIFETMVFGPAWHDLDCRRYCTEVDAAAGHQEIVTLVRATTQTAEDVLTGDAPTRRDDQ